MWFRRRRRRHPPPHLLPSLDNLAELVSRVVEQVDELVVEEERKPAAARPEWRVQAVGEGIPLAEPEVPVDEWVAFAGLSTGYRLVEQSGPLPARGDVVELEGGPFRVLRLGPSPLPGDARRCAFLERQEPPNNQRNDEP